MQTEVIEPYAPAIIKLLQGPLYWDDRSAWNLLLGDISAVKAYFARIGLEVYLNEVDGYAYLKQAALENEDDQTVSLPRLTRRDKLSYHVTVLCVLLRERLDQFDASSPESDQLIVTQQDLYELMRPFMKERSDERALFNKIDSHIKRVVELSFLRLINDSRAELPFRQARYEVRRILRARVNSEKLAEIKEKLLAYDADESQS